MAKAHATCTHACIHTHTHTTLTTRQRDQILNLSKWIWNETDGRKKNGIERVWHVRTRSRRDRRRPEIFTQHWTNIFCAYKRVANDICCPHVRTLPVKICFDCCQLKTELFDRISSSSDANSIFVVVASLLRNVNTEKKYFEMIRFRDLRHVNEIKCRRFTGSEKVKVCFNLDKMC